MCYGILLFICFSLLCRFPFGFYSLCHGLVVLGRHLRIQFQIGFQLVQLRLRLLASLLTFCVEVRYANLCLRRAFFGAEV